MNVASNGPDENTRLLAEIATLRRERNTLFRQLSDCNRTVRELRAEIERLQS